MDWLEFIAAIVGHLAWPGVVGGGLFLFRKSIVERLPYLRKASWGDKSVEFGDTLQVATEKAALIEPQEEQKQLPPPAEAATEEEQVEERFASALQASPRFAVLEAWFPVEQELQRIARNKGYSADRTRSPTYTLRQLQNDGTLPSETASLINDLMKLRNIAAHARPGVDITADEAIAYRDISGVVLEQLRAMKA